MARVWITDGSLIPFRGVHELTAYHRAQFGLRATYKGLIDPAVQVGTATVRSARPDDILYPEAEWCLSFPEGIARYLAEPDALDLSTPIVLQGMIEGKWLNRLLDTDDWGPATLGNNLLADGLGVPTTFLSIEHGVEGAVEVSYRSARADTPTQSQSSMLADLRGQNILELARGVLRFCRDSNCTVDAIDLGAIGETAAVVNDRRRIRDAMRFGLGALPHPAYFVLPRRRLDLMRKVVRAILDEGRGAPPGATISIRTVGPGDVVVGRGSLVWEQTPI